VAERRALTPEDIRELKHQGIVFSSPLAIKMLCLGLILVVIFVGSEGVQTLQAPDTLADLKGLALRALFGATLLACAVIFTTLLTSLVCNGFFMSPALLSPRRRSLPRDSFALVIIAVCLGAALSAIVFLYFSKPLFTQLVFSEPVGTALPQGLSELWRRLATRIIVGSVILAILVTGVARAWFLFSRRPLKNPSSNEG